MARSALQFLTQRLLDRDVGGVFGAADPTGERPLSTDKQLSDQASAVLALVDHGTEDDLRVAVEGLRHMQDHHHGHPGFTELTDRYWRAYPAGRVRTVRYQLHAATALLAAAHRLDFDELRVRALDLVHRCFGTIRDGRLPTRLTEDWRCGLDEAETPQTAVAVVRALAVAEAVGEPGLDVDVLPPTADRLAQLVDAATSPHHATEPARCGATARMVHALAHAGRMLDAEKYLKAAELLLHHLLDRFLDREHGAFWDRLAPDGVPRVDWAEAPRRGGMPFPVKRTADAAQVLLAGRLLASCGVDSDEATGLAHAAVGELTDRRHGGVYLGIGYQWATLTDPAVTSLRQLWTPQGQPGLLVSGGLRHLALQQKSAHTHATVVRALDDPETPPAPEPRDEPHRDRVTTASARPSTADVAPAVDGSVALPFDRDRYLDSLLTTRLGVNPAVQATSTASPAWHVSPAYHTIADLLLIGAEPPLPVELIDRIRLSQNGDGGFGEQPDQLSDVASTYCAVVALRLAGASAARPGAAADFLRGCQHADGGFGAVPGLPSDVWHTGLAVAALRVLGAPVDADGCAEFVLSTRTGDGGYASRPDRPANGFAVRRAVSALVLLDRPVPDPDGTLGWLRRCQLPGGGFTHRPGHAVSLLGTQHVVAALALLDARPAAVEACQRWLVSQQNPDGQFGSHDSLPTTAADSFACVQSLSVLGGGPNRDWVALVG
jgi:prenyltransferase beta subunit